MTRKLVVSLTLGVSLLCMLAVSVEAQRGRRHGRRHRRGHAAQQEQTPPDSAAIAEALGELHWGMEPREVHQFFVNKIHERFRERLTKAPGTIEEDRIRHEMDGEVRRLRESYVRFDGDRTGWDLSFLRSEFTHGNRESMLVYRDENSQNFYFFIQGRLWKWFKAFDASVFRGQSFDQFAQAVQGRFGPAADRTGTLVDGGPTQHWLEWQDPTTRLRAVDQTRFYGFYCLVFEDRATLSRLDQLRNHTIPSQTEQGHALVDSVTLPEGSEENVADGNADIVDRITGHIRRRPARGEGNTATSSNGGGASSSGPSSEPSHDSGHSSSGSSDPLDLSDL